MAEVRRKLELLAAAIVLAAGSAYAAVTLEAMRACSSRANVPAPSGCSAADRDGDGDVDLDDFGLWQRRARRISGRVLDEQGRPVPGAQVVATSHQ